MNQIHTSYQPFLLRKNIEKKGGFFLRLNEVLELYKIGWGL